MVHVYIGDFQWEFLMIINIFWLVCLKLQLWIQWNMQSTCWYVCMHILICY